MKNKIRYLLLIGYCFVAIISRAQQTDKPKTYFDEKFGIILGAGIDYSLIAPRIHVKTFKNGYVQASCSYSQIYKFVWNLGLEYRFPLMNNRWCPYVQLTFGDNRPSELSWMSSPREFQRVNRIFQGPSFGTGMKFRYTKERKFYISFNLNYTRPIKLEKEFFKDLNNKAGTNFKPYNSLTPSIGLSIALRK